VAQLVEPGETPDAAVRIVMPDQARRLWKGPEGGWAQLEAGTHGPDMLELWTWELHPGERFTAQAHSPGAREIIRVLSGALRLEVGGVSHVLQAATAAVARTDRPHSYACAGAAPVRFTMVVHEPPSSAP
jgi:quercetin dioxygenase-like cupin family protein